MSTSVKDLLVAAAGPNGKGDDGWHAERADRMYFSDPHDLDSAGSVDVRTEGGKESDYVRVELYVRPDLAAEIIALVTGEKAAADHEIRVRLRAEVRLELQAEAEAAVQAEAVPTEPETVPFVDDGAQAEIARRDAARKIELNALIAEQEADEASEATSDDDDEPEDDEEAEEADEEPAPRVTGALGSALAPIDLTAVATSADEDDLTIESDDENEDDEEAA